MLDEFNIKLGEALRIKREQAGLNQPELAEKLGVSKVAVHQWETGKRNMYAKALSNYCDALGITIESVVELMKTL